MEVWKTLVHVCRRWRSLVLGSPCHLNLLLFCTPKTPARDTLNVWPTLPLIVSGDMTISTSCRDNIFAALRQSNRVREVVLWDFDIWQLENVVAAMQVPLPELTRPGLWSYESPDTIPDSFLGGSARRLRSFELDGIPFPGLRNLLLSTNHLAHLSLSNIPDSGGILSDGCSPLRVDRPRNTYA